MEIVPSTATKVNLPRLCQQESVTERRSRLVTIGKKPAGGLDQSKPVHLILAESRASRYELMEFAGGLLKGEAVSYCHKDTIPRHSPDDEQIELYIHKEGTSAHFAGLKQCGSPWTCAVCAAKIAERKRERLTVACSRWRKAGKEIAFITYTVSHRKEDKLGCLLPALLAAKAEMRQSHEYAAWKRKYAVAGNFTALEATWSPVNGWHPHLHELCFFDRALDTETASAAGQELALIWSECAKGYGLQTNSYGLNFQLADTKADYVEAYITKMGVEPDPDYLRRKWTVERELVSSASKKAGRSGKAIHFNNWELLILAREGKRWALDLWLEFVRVMKGRHQLEPSRKLYALLLPDYNNLSDKQLVEEKGKDTVKLLTISKELWAGVVYWKAQGIVINYALGFNSARVHKLLQSLYNAMQAEIRQKEEDWIEQQWLDLQQKDTGG